MVSSLTRSRDRGAVSKKHAAVIERPSLDKAELGHAGSSVGREEPSSANQHAGVEVQPVLVHEPVLAQMGHEISATEDEEILARGPRQSPDDRLGTSARDSELDQSAQFIVMENTTFGSPFINSDSGPVPWGQNAANPAYVLRPRRRAPACRSISMWNSVTSREGLRRRNSISQLFVP